MLLSEIVFNIQNLKFKGRQSQSNTLSDRQVVFIVNYYYSKLVKQELEKYGNRNQAFWYDLGTLELEKVDATTIDSNIECGTLINSFETHCILRTKNKIPKTIFFRDGIALNYVGNVDLSEAYVQSTVTKILQSKYYKYTKDITRYFLLNDYIYIVKPKTDNQKYIRVSGVWENPLDAYLVNNEASDIFNIEYPIPSYLMDTIIKLISETEFNILFNLGGDTTNNLHDESTNHRN